MTTPSFTRDGRAIVETIDRAPYDYITIFWRIGGRLISGSGFGEAAARRNIEAAYAAAFPEPEPLGATLEFVYFTEGRSKVEYADHLRPDGDLFEVVSRFAWEEEAPGLLASIVWVREADTDRILAVAHYRPGADPAHPDLVVTAGRETRVYAYEEAGSSYRARLARVARV